MKKFHNYFYEIVAIALLSFIGIAGGISLTQAYASGSLSSATTSVTGSNSTSYNLSTGYDACPDATAELNAYDTAAAGGKKLCKCEVKKGDKPISPQPAAKETVRARCVTVYNVLALHCYPEDEGFTVKCKWGTEDLPKPE